MGKRRVKKKIDKQTAASSPVPNVDTAYDPQVVDGEVPIINQEALKRTGLSAKKLSWVQRIGGAIGVARVIQFLHTGIVPGVFFNSLKITDILLDHDLQVKISCHNQRKLAEFGGLLRVSVTVDDTARKSLVDLAVQKGCSDESLKKMMEICLRCLSNEPKDRPSVEDVLWNLQFAAQVQDSWKGTL